MYTRLVAIGIMFAFIGIHHTASADRPIPLAANRCDGDLNGDWRVSINPAILTLQENTFDTLDVTINSHAALGSGTGTLRRLDFNRYRGSIRQLSGSTCYAVFTYLFVVQSSNRIDVTVEGNDGACGVTAGPMINYYIYR